ncbi:MAG: HEPN domain-containing protein [Sulfolobales archaeon]
MVWLIGLSGERVELLKRRSRVFLGVGRELLERGVLDLAAFNIQQSCQLRVKASMLRLLGDFPRIFSVRELLGILAARLDEMGFSGVAMSLRDFARRYRDSLADIDAIYTMARYGFFTYTAKDVEEMLRICGELDRVLEEVERDVLG